MNRRLEKVLILGALSGVLGLRSQTAAASAFEFLLGPPSLGQGGSNPLSIPPANPADWQLNYVNEAQRETVYSLLPGILYGQRFYLDQLYAALGGGLLFTSGGLGIGVYHAVGYQSEKFLKSLRMHVEYRQVIGLANYGAQFPYTLRLGLSYEF